MATVLMALFEVLSLRNVSKNNAFCLHSLDIKHGNVWVDAMGVFLSGGGRNCSQPISEVVCQDETKVNTVKYLGGKQGMRMIQSIPHRNRINFQL